MASGSSFSSIMASTGSMASSSSSSGIMASPGANPSSYDVFLSFRGEDTRYSFTDHLYEALKRRGLNPFRDNEIPRGEELKPEIEKAIKQSKTSIVVLSENYADSTWCLDELWLILEQRRNCNHFVLPIFYHVDTSDVGKHHKTFAIQVRSTGRWTNDNVIRWKEALTEIVGLTGVVASGPETKLLDDIVDTIYTKVDPKLLSLPPNLIGLDTRAEKISYWLNRSDAKFFVICGMGGSGKTTLAKYVLKSNWRKFKNISFVENIGVKCKESYGLPQLQEQLLEDILGGKNRKIPGVSQGTCKLEKALQMKMALIVLDDIDEQSQLLALLGTGEINTESKIIITTRVLNIKEWLESRSWRCWGDEMKLLNEKESLELLSLHAFSTKIPMEGFEELSVQAALYCQGNPLALQVLGSSLSESNSIPVWKSRLSLLEKDTDSGIQAVLIRSYNSLPHDHVRELFLHIACFFIGIDMDYVVKILEDDYSATFGIKILTNRCLLSVSPNKKLTMHRLLQDMGRSIVHQESPKDPRRCSRLWRNKDSYDVLKKGKGSKTVEGLALDMQMLREEKYAFKPSDLKTESLKKMDNLKLLQLKYVQLTGSYENFSEHLRWLCCIGSNLKSIPFDLFMGNLVAIDMSHSKLEVFELPEVVQSLQILNLKDSHNLFEIRNISLLPNLETLILWNCHSLVRVCESIRGLKSLTLLNMTGCENLYKGEELSLYPGLNASTFSGGSTQQPSFSLPRSLERLFLKGCNLECTDYFPLSFRVQSFLQYLNLVNGLFEFLPDYTHLKNLRVLDLSFCSRLKWLLCLPSTLAELYTYYCKSLEKITFQSHRFRLQEFAYEGCVNLCEIEDFIKLVPIVKLDETDLGHMKWLKEYQNNEMSLVGDDELTIGRSCHLQMLYEFGIMSTSLPFINDPNMMPVYRSKSQSLSFDVPVCPTNRRLIGLNVSFQYKISGEVCAWFAKISTSSGIDLMYNPKVFGKPAFYQVTTWLSYWPIGNTLNVGDKVNVFIAVMSGLEVLNCGATLVYTEDDEAEGTLKNNMDWVELSGFQLSTGAHYLCRCDFFELMEVGRITPGWFKILVGDTIDNTEVLGWRKTGRPQQLNPSFTELRTVRCIIHGPQSEEVYRIAEMSKSSFVGKTMDLISNTPGEIMKSATTSDFGDAATNAGDMDIDMDMDIVMDVDMSEASVIDKTVEFTSSSITKTRESTTGSELWKSSAKKRPAPNMHKDAPPRRVTSNQAATNALREAKNHKHMADRIKNLGSNLESRGLYMQAALMFLQGASLLESGHSETERYGDMIQSMQLYSSTAKLFEYCAHEYEKTKEMATAALAYKCMEVAYLKVVYSSHTSAYKDLHELQTPLLQMRPTASGECLSSSSSEDDPDNLNNPVTFNKAVKDVGSSQAAGNLVIAAQNKPKFTRILNFTHDVNFAMEALRNSRIAFVASGLKEETSLSAVKTALDFNFYDLDKFLQLVRVALDEINR